MGRAIAYIRVSTEDQEAQGTQEAQTNAISAFCLSRGLQVQEWFEEQESTLNPDRPEFQRLMEKVRSGEVNTIVVAALDRFSRDQIETLQAVQTIKKAGASFYCIRDNINITNGQADFASEMVISVMSLFAKNERDTIRTRTMQGKQRKQRTGKWVTGQAPLGYELDRQTKVLKVNRAEAVIVQHIFKLRMGGLGVISIIKKLNSTKDPLYEKRYVFKGSRYCKVSQRHRNSGYCRVRHFHQDYQGCHECAQEYGGVNITGTSWSTTLIKKALKNRVYLGEIQVEGKWIPGAHKPIIDEATFDTVQEILAKAYRHPYEFHARNPLAGLMHCHCGSRMYATASFHTQDKTGKQGKKYWAFVCPKKKLGQCTQHNVPIPMLLNLVFKRINDILQGQDIGPLQNSTLGAKTAEIIKKAYERILNESNESKPYTKDLKRELQEVTQETTRLARSYTQATVAGVKAETLSEMVDRIKISEERKASIEAKIEFSEMQNTALKDELQSLSYEQLMSHLSSLWMYFSKEPLKGNEVVGRMIRAFIKQIQTTPRTEEFPEHRGLKISLRFDEKLLEQPLDKLLQAVLKLHRLGKNQPDLSAMEQDTSFL